MKYPRTFHLTFSHCSNDDKILDDNSYFLNREIIISSKLDGSSVALSNGDVFARSHAQVPTHPSFNLLKQIHSELRHSIHPNLIIYAEWLYARHTNKYTQLPSYLQVFNILDKNSHTFLSWIDVELVCDILNINTVPVLFSGIVKTEKELEKLVLSLAKEKEFDIDEREGVVVRDARFFQQDEFPKSVAKYVKKSFTESIGDEHWKHKNMS
jgi:ATP-dependent RNA circularization protein (DNA/RNA ligase family)